MPEEGYVTTLRLYHNDGFAGSERRSWSATSAEARAQRLLPLSERQASQRSPRPQAGRAVVTPPTKPAPAGGADYLLEEKQGKILYIVEAIYKVSRMS